MKTAAARLVLAGLALWAGRGALASAPLAPRLSQTGLYADIASKTVDPANEIFAPQYPLWTDGAVKTRWVRLPPGGRIDTSNMDRWVFPVGTKLWKEFSFRDGAGVLRRVETRMIEKRGADDWSFASYVWNDDESDAVLAPSEGLPDHFPIGGGLSHDIPGTGDCNYCHSRGGDRVLGFDALQLSADRDGPPGPGLDLAALAARGLLTRAPDRQPKIAAPTAAARGARGYLHGNCGHCHNPEGAASATGMFLRHQIDGVAREEDQPIVATAVGKRTRGFDIPGRAETYRLKPGDPDASAVYYRMGRRGGSEQMPPLGTKKADPKGLSLVLEWIKELPPSGAEESARLRAYARRLEEEIARTSAAF
jgi:mono/diheme cytochrome c family protein